MSPFVFLMILVAGTVIALGVQIVLRRVRSGGLRQLAQAWGMHFTPGDRFRLRRRIVDRLSMPGAAGVHVQDVIYGTEGEKYRYYFTVEYTSGVLKRKIDHRNVCTTTEPKERQVGGRVSEIVTAPPYLPLVEQYEHLHKAEEGETSLAPTDRDAGVASTGEGNTSVAPTS